VLHGILIPPIDLSVAKSLFHSLSSMISTPNPNLIYGGSLCSATSKMPRPEFQEIERLVQLALSTNGGWRKMIVTDEGKLICLDRLPKLFALDTLRLLTQ
jgi:hypothetical protein